MALIADEVLALFAGLNASHKKSYLSEYSCRIDPRKTDRFLTAWHHRILGTKLLTGESFNLDFHSVPFYGEDPMVRSEEHTSELQSQSNLVCRLLLEKNNDLAMTTSTPDSKSVVHHSISTLRSNSLPSQLGSARMLIVAGSDPACVSVNANAEMSPPV